MSKHKNTRKIMVSLGVVGAAAAVAGMGTFGTFTSTTSGSASVTSGTVVIGLGANGTANDLSIAATNVVPGDTIQRAVTLNNTGTTDLGTVSLTTSVLGTSSLLDSDATKGLQLKIDSCSAAWTKTTSAAGVPTYTCTGTGAVVTPVVASKSVIGTSPITSSTGLKTLTGNDNLLVTLTLPTLADDTFQGKTSTINFKFDATQRGATNK